MRIKTLDIYQNFKCVAGDCKHSCCEKWQIDIDKRSLKKYSRIKGEFSERIAEGIDFENKCFKMNNGRCAFLNKDNLCDMYIHCGEKSLCQVCKDHPRFRNYFGRNIETGVGLCCEVIAKRLTEKKEYVKELQVKESFLPKKVKGFDKKITEEREKYKSILFSELSIKDKIIKILNDSLTDTERFLSFNWKDKLLSLEILDAKWREYLSKLDGKLSVDIAEKYNVLYSNLIFCSIFRHLPNSIDNIDIKSRAVFAVFFALIVSDIVSKTDENNSEIAECVLFFSSEIEYCDENVSKLLDIFDVFVDKNQ